VRTTLSGTRFSTHKQKPWRTGLSFQRWQGFQRLLFSLIAFATLTVQALAVPSHSNVASHPGPSPSSDFGEDELQPTLVIRYRDDNTPHLLLDNRDAHQQLLVTSADHRDVTRQVKWSVVPEGIVRIDVTGRVSPLADGSAILTARVADGTSAELSVTVENFDESLPIHFANRVVPLFTKYGCNGGGCHGKAAGQNGFQLSLLGFEPDEDYEHLVREARGRRLFPAAPERSLLLTKATAQLPHGGGKRLEPDSDDYILLTRWIRQGMPMGPPDAPTVQRIEVFPKEATLDLNQSQQLIVTAIYSNDSREDVTRSALYEPNDPDLAKAAESGLVTVFDQPGEVSVMIRYQSQVATFRATLPLGAPVEHLPVARNFIDDHIFQQLLKVGMPPSAVVDDATFLRRTTLDIAGRLPTLSEVLEFKKSTKENRRDQVIDRLLASPDYAEFFANKWSALLRNKRTEGRHTRGTYAFHAWIRDNLDANKPYDQWVRELLTASGDLVENPPVAWYRQVRSMNQQLEDVAQLFLGQRLQCAQCHHHPYERWSQADYWSFGAAFSKVAYKPGSQPGESIVFPRRGIAQAINKKTGQPVSPAALGEAPMVLSLETDPRQPLADWMTAPGNPWFAKAVVNRYWKHFFGRGLVDPEDDLRDTNPATHPVLLQELALDFETSGFDLKHLVRILTQSTTYQLSADPNDYNGRDRHHFSRFHPRRLPAEILMDAVHHLMGSQIQFDGLPVGTRAVALPDNSFNATSYFLTVFGRPESNSACECERSLEASLSQSLHLINSQELQTKLTADQGRAAELAFEDRDDLEKVNELYQLALARDPQPNEIEAVLSHLTDKLAQLTQVEVNEPAEVSVAIEQARAARLKVRREAWEDVVWALLNTKEFLFNH